MGIIRAEIRLSFLVVGVSPDVVLRAAGTVVLGGLVLAVAWLIKRAGLSSGGWLWWLAVVWSIEPALVVAGVVLVTIDDEDGPGLCILSVVRVWVFC